MEPVRALNIVTDAEGVLIERPNRFLARIGMQGREGSIEPVDCHVHDPGRLKEILYPGNRILLKKAGNPHRKTSWDVIAGQNGKDWILINSAIHRQLAEWILASDHCPLERVAEYRAEVKMGHSRIDFLAQTEAGETVIEVKGCTLASDGIALFPDAPTERGARHMDVLREVVEDEGRASAFIFVFRPEVIGFSPNEGTDPRFAESFWNAIDAGVEAHPLKFDYVDGWVRYLGPIGLKR